MGLHSAPTETAVDPIDISDEAVHVFEDAWEDFTDDGKLTRETRDRLVRTGRTALQSVVAFVLTAVVVAVVAEVRTGHVSPAELLDAAKVAALTSLGTVASSFLHPKRKTN